jgi:hypothetical protein
MRADLRGPGGGAGSARHGGGGSSGHGGLVRGGGTAAPVIRVLSFFRRSSLLVLGPPAEVCWDQWRPLSLFLCAPTAAVLSPPLLRLSADRGGRDRSRRVEVVGMAPLEMDPVRPRFVTPSFKRQNQVHRSHVRQDQVTHAMTL